MENNLFLAALLGLLEGLTEFIPVSSTGHLLLAGTFLGFQSSGKSFEILIQFGAILAVICVYFTHLWQLLLDLPRSKHARRFVLAILLAFLPAVCIGIFAHEFIRKVLFETPELICTTLLIGGIILIYVDRLTLKPHYKQAQDIPLKTALFIGIFQCIAFIPGVSRSGATIVGALLMKVEKRAAAEFSFYLAMPTMAGAFGYDLLINHDKLSSDEYTLIIIGFICAFISGFLVVRWLLDYVSRKGYALFGWWRIIVALLGFAGLYLF